MDDINLIKEKLASISSEIKRTEDGLRSFCFESVETENLIFGLCQFGNKRIIFKPTGVPLAETKVQIRIKHFKEVNQLLENAVELIKSKMEEN